MANLTITEINKLAFDPHGSPILAPEMPALKESNVAVTGAHLESDPFVNGARYIMVNTDTACGLAFGENPVASTVLHRMGANETRFYGVIPGHRLSVVAS